MGSCHLHRLVDRGRTNVERASEDERETKHIVDLVRIVTPTSGDNRIWANLPGDIVGNLWIWIRKGKNNRFGGHALQHLRSEAVCYRATKEDVCSLHRLGQGAASGLTGVALLVLVHALATTLIDHSLGVHEEEVLARRTKLFKEPRAGKGRGPGTIHYNLHILDLLACDL